MKLKDIAGLLPKKMNIERFNIKESAHGYNQCLADISEKEVVGEICPCWWKLEEIPTHNCHTCKGTGVVIKVKDNPRKAE